MDGINAPEYIVTMEFFVYANDDDAALDKVTRVLPKGDFDIAWAWKNTQLINKGEKMTQTIKVPHTVELVTEFDAAHPMTHRLMALPDGVLSNMLVETFIAVVNEQGFFDKINEGNQYATLKLARDSK